MKIEVKYTQFHATPDIEAYVAKRVGQMERLLRSFEKNREVTVFFEIARTTKHHKKGDVFYAEAMLEAGGKKMRGAATAPDIRLAVDDVKEKLKKEIRRHKDKLVEQRRR